MLTTILLVLGAVALLVVAPRLTRATPAVAAPVDAPPPEPIDLARVPSAARPHRRDAFVPRVAEGDAPGSSGYSGVPALRPGEPWPACARCGGLLQLMVQLRAAHLPPEAAARLDGGILQLFHCTRECTEPTLRLLGADEAVADAPAMPAGMYPPRRITGWTRVDDFPDAQELEAMGTTLEVPIWEAYDDQDLPHSGDKLLGWPAWVQGVDYASCPRCGTRMEQLFQLGPECNLPWMYGDMGTCHVLQCPTHHDALSLTCACS